MIVIPRDKFIMGSAEGKGDNNERPQHWIRISLPFAMSKFEVTFDQWNACVNAGACSGYKPSDQDWRRGKRPIINVNWADARAYAAWLAAKTGQHYRLLTEAEWEYAARARKTTAYAWGDKIGKGNANCRDCGSEWDGKQTALVGSFKANAFGLHDMQGNVHEWTRDCWHENYKGAPDNGKAWISGDYCRGCVLRGGSWNDWSESLRSAARNWDGPDDRNYYIGFRVGRALAP